jgi:hypothetical protein
VLHTSRWPSLGHVDRHFWCISLKIYFQNRCRFPLNFLFSQETTVSRWLLLNQNVVGRKDHAHGKVGSWGSGGLISWYRKQKGTASDTETKSIARDQILNKNIVSRNEHAYTQQVKLVLTSVRQAKCQYSEAQLLQAEVTKHLEHR